MTAKSAGAFFRFLVAGGLNTLITVALFVSLSLFIHPSVAYTISFAAGIVFSYVVSVIFVFKTSLNLRSAFKFPLVYLVQYFYGLAALTVLVSGFQLNPRVAILFVAITSAPLTYILSRRVVNPEITLKNTEISSR